MARQQKISGQERRSEDRHYARQLVVLLEKRLYPVVDISTGGLSFQCNDAPVESRLSLKVAAMSDLMAGIDAQCEVRGSGNGRIRVAFTRPTLPLLRFLIQHIGQVTGIRPHILNKR